MKQPRTCINKRDGKYQSFIRKQFEYNYAKQRKSSALRKKKTEGAKKIHLPNWYRALRIKHSAKRSAREEVVKSTNWNWKLTRNLNRKSEIINIWLPRRMLPKISFFFWKRRNPNFDCPAISTPNSFPLQIKWLPRPELYPPPSGFFQTSNSNYKKKRHSSQVVVYKQIKLEKSLP